MQVLHLIVVKGINMDKYFYYGPQNIDFIQDFDSVFITKSVTQLAVSKPYLFLCPPFLTKQLKDCRQNLHEILLTEVIIKIVDILILVPGYWSKWVEIPSTDKF